MNRDLVELSLARGRTKNKSKLILSLSIFSLIFISACAPKLRMAAPSMSAPTSVSVSRYAHIEENFETIAGSIDTEEVNSNIMEVLEMCESGEANMLVYKRIAESRFLYIDTSVRVYMEILQGMGNYEERINSVAYNDEGLITRIIQTRE